jgi:large subunit ribosomal protein L15
MFPTTIRQIWRSGSTRKWSSCIVRQLPVFVIGTTSTTVSTHFSSMATATVPQQRTLQLEPVQILRLNTLQDNPGAIKNKRRVGRGIGSSKGKTCGRGHKGQKARSGAKIHPTFEGGQTPLYKLFPKRGFKNIRHATTMNGINLGTIQMYVTMRRLDPTQPITLAAMKDAGMFKANAVKHGVKLLATGSEQLKQPLTIKVNRASASAIAAVEEAGGSVVTVHLNRLSLRTELRPEKFTDGRVPKHARPPPKYQPYYTSYHKRGYLNPAVQMFTWFQKKKLGNDSDVAVLETKFQDLLSISKKKFGVQEEIEANVVSTGSS